MIDNKPHDNHFSDCQVSFHELCRCANISTDYITELVDYDIIVPIAGGQPQEWQFNVQAIAMANKAARLHRDLEIDWADIALLLNLQEEIIRLKNENSQLKRQLQRFSAA